MFATFRRVLTFAAVCLLPLLASAANGPSAGNHPPKNWRVLLNDELPLLGHRNWIAVVDSAYPLQTSAGIETVDTNVDQLEVVKAVLDQVAKAKHVRPVIFTDAELKLVSESDAKGVTAYREALTTLVGKTGSRRTNRRRTIFWRLRVRRRIQTATRTAIGTSLCSTGTGTS